MGILIIIFLLKTEFSEYFGRINYVNLFTKFIVGLFFVSKLVLAYLQLLPDTYIYLVGFQISNTNIKKNIYILLNIVYDIRVGKLNQLCSLSSLV